MWRPWARQLEPRLLYRIWTKDGHEELVRGAVFGDLDVRSLRSDLIAAGTVPAVEDRAGSSLVQRRESGAIV